MRTITKTFFNRLAAQAEEASIQKLEKIADHVTGEITKYADSGAVRDDAAEYTYTGEEMMDDVKQALWSAAVRVQDYYGKVIDAGMVNDLIEACATDLVESIRVKSGRILGAYEPAVPGEDKAAIEISEND